MTEASAHYSPPDWLKLWLDHIPRGQALELGAGHGQLAAWLHERGFRVTAVERQPAALEVLRQREADGQLSLIVEDLADYRPDPARYSLVVASSVFHFIPPKRMAELSQALVQSLVPGGFLMAEAFTVDDPSYRLRRSVQEPIAARTFSLEGRQGIIHYFERGELRERFAGLQVLFYWEGRRLDPASAEGYRAGATLVARRWDH